MTIKEIMAKMLPQYLADSAPESPFVRLADNLPIWRAGDIHGGIDFNFQDPANNTNGVAEVRSPVARTVVFVENLGAGRH